MKIKVFILKNDGALVEGIHGGKIGIGTLNAWNNYITNTFVNDGV